MKLTLVLKKKKDFFAGLALGFQTLVSHRSPKQLELNP